MMKIIFISIAIFFLLSVQIFGQYNYRLRVSGGLSFPVEPTSFQKYWNDGINLNGGFGFNVKENISIDINFEYYNFSFKSDNFINHFANLLQDIKGVQNSIEVLSLFPSLNFNLKKQTSSFYPYINFGIGWLRYSTDETEINFSNGTIKLSGESKSLMILLVGIGLNYDIVDNVALFIETNYRYGSIDNNRINFLPIKVGILINI